MTPVQRWQELAGRLPAGWVDAHVTFHVSDPEELDRAAALLGPLQVVRSSAGTLSFRVATDGTGPSPESAERLLDRLGREGIDGTLAIESSTVAPAATTAAPPPLSLAESWDAALATLPADWSDLLGEIELESSDYVERGALHLSPLNPRRDGNRLAFQFRCARVNGYGASPGMVRRCLERCDAERMVGRVHVLRVLSDSRPVQTQGPVWQIAGRTV